MLAVESLVRNNYYDKFIDYLMRKMNPSDDSKDKFVNLANSLWVDLSELAIGSRYASGSVYIKKDPDVDFGTTNHCLVTDDGKKATATIAGVKGIITGKLSALWKWGKGDKEVNLEPAKIELAGNNSLLKLTYDSPAAMKFKDTEILISANEPSTITLTQEGSSNKENITKYVHYKKIKEEEKDVGLNLTLDRNEYGTRESISIKFKVSEKDEDAYAKYKLKCERSEKKEEACLILQFKNVEPVSDPTGNNIASLPKEDDGKPAKYAITGTGDISFTIGQPSSGLQAELVFTVPTGYKKIEAIRIPMEKSASSK